ncbi:FAD-binding domain-containing protein [Mycena crocata]|nr:FAD-binding domain-containing protein [Mycena crocata]
MKIFVPSLGILLVGVLPLFSCGAEEVPSTLKRQTCRNVPGSAGYPTTAAWNAFNASISGRLLNVVPSAKYCASLPGGACTDAQWTSALFRSTLPGAMDQGYDLTPPSLCIRNATTCGQGDVPTYSVEAESVTDIQAAVKFANAHNLRVAVKASGHDCLGRSTAPQSLLIRTTKFQNLSATDMFFLGTQNVGSAVTVGSVVQSRNLYTQAKAAGKIAVGGSAGTVCAAGGYLQGAGHSALSPTFGLAVDNVLGKIYLVFRPELYLNLPKSFKSGELLKVNSISNPDLFFAFRGGGAGSWGVIVSASFRTFPFFNITFSVIQLAASSNAAAAALATVHTQHIFDLDGVHGSQYFNLNKDFAANATSVFTLTTYLPGTPVATGKTLLAPFLRDVLAIPGVSLVSEDYKDINVNDALFQPDDVAGLDFVMGSRLIPEAAYRNSPANVGKVFKELLDAGTFFLGPGAHISAGKVSTNANISSAVHPDWRTAKTHLILLNSWTDSTPLDQINTIRHEFQNKQLPIIEQISGPDGGAYSNEADVFEPNFQTTFFGPNYAKLSAIKRKYDPGDLFIVSAGVGSERWDEWGLCTV